MLFKLFGVITLATVSIWASVSHAQEPGDVSFSPSVSSQSTTNTSNSTIAADQPTHSANTFGPTERGTYLWRIAKQVRTEKEPTTIYQWMYGIWITNLDAFKDSNMHLLENGKLLQIPPLEEISSISQSLATETYTNHLNLLQPSTQLVHPVKNAQPETLQASVVITDHGLKEAGLKKIEIQKPTDIPIHKFDSDKWSSKLKVTAVEHAVTQHKDTHEMAVSNEFAMDVNLTQGANLATDVRTNQPKDAVDLVFTIDLSQLLEVDKDSVFYLFTLDHLKNSYIINSGISWLTIAIFFLIVMRKTNLPNRIRQWISGLNWNYRGFRSYAEKRSVSSQHSQTPTSFNISSFIDYLTVEDNTDTRFEFNGGSNHHIRLALSLSGIFASYGDIEKAINLLQKTTEIQPENILVKQLLLKLYYKSRNLDDFKSLITEIKDDLHQLDLADQVKLHSMYMELFADSEPVFDLPSAKIRDEENLKVSRSSQNPNLQTSPGMNSFIDYLSTENHNELLSDYEEPSKGGRQAETPGSPADVIATYSDTDKTVNLLQQTAVILHLLKIHHKAQNTEEFKSLIIKSKFELAELDEVDKAKVQMMYSDLFPDSDTIIEIPDSENSEVSGECNSPAKDLNSAQKSFFGNRFVENLKEASANSSPAGRSDEEVFDIMDILTREVEDNDQDDNTELDLSDKFPELDEMIPQSAAASIDNGIDESSENRKSALRLEPVTIEAKNNLETKQENIPIAVFDEPGKIELNKSAKNLNDNHFSDEILSVLSDMRNELKKLNARLDQTNNN